VKGFLRSYADYLGLDGQLYVDEFNSRYVRGEFEDEEEQPFRTVGGPGWRRSGSLQGKAVLVTIAVIVGLTVFVFAAAKYGNHPNQTGVNLLGGKTPSTPAKSQPQKLIKLVASAAPGSAYVAVYRG